MSFHLEGLPALIAIFITIAIPLGIFTFILANVSKFTRRKSKLSQNTIIAEYDPPENLSPAEMGYLFDSRLDKQELVATLIDLEQKGLLAFQKRSLEGMVINVSNRGQDKHNLRQYEKDLLDRIGAEANLSVYSLLNKSSFGYSIKKSLAAKGYIKSQREVINYLAQRTLVAYFLLTMPILIWTLFQANGEIMIMFLVMMFVFIMFFPFFFGLALITGYIYNKIVGQPGMWTDKLKKLWPELEGYREYVRQVELDELQFESKDLKIRSKNKTLPYAIALGLNTEWQDSFK